RIAEHEPGDLRADFGPRRERPVRPLIRRFALGDREQLVRGVARRSVRRVGAERAGAGGPELDEAARRAPETDRGIGAVIAVHPRRRSSTRDRKRARRQVDETVVDELRLRQLADADDAAAESDGVALEDEAA